MADERSSNVVDQATSITIAWLNNPNVRPTADDVAAFLDGVHAKLAGFAGGEAVGGGVQPAAAPTEVAAGTHAAAVTVRKSLGSRDKIISMIDGKPYSSLKRHLTSHGLTPDQYRERYGLKTDYPMVAPAYAEKRRELAKKIGLGRKPTTRTKKPAAAPKTPRRRGRPPKAAKPASEVKLPAG
jgi:predicted transcriptional regulator